MAKKPSIDKGSENKVDGRDLILIIDDEQIRLEVRVPLKEELKKCLLFGLSRLSVAMILGYLGHRHEVMPIMQTICHSTRAYMVNAKCMPGFVMRLPQVLKIYKNADSAGELKEAAKW